MEDSILKSTKQILGLEPDYDVFDLDVMTHINGAFVFLNQLGIGPPEGFSISGDQSKWEDLDAPDHLLGMVKTYLYLKVRSLFDPPSTGPLNAAMEKQIEEMEWRLTTHREVVPNEAIP